MKQALSRGGLALLTLALAACTGRTPLHGAVPRFQIIPVTSFQEPVPILPEVERYGPATLTVSLQEVLRGYRRVLATMAEVEVVRVTVRFDSGGSPIELVEEVARAALAAGQNSVTFSGLPVGGVWIQIDALNSQQQVIGSSRQQVQLRETAPTLVNVAVPVSGPAGSGGGSSGGSVVPGPLPAPSATGEIAVDVSLIDGSMAPGEAPGTVLSVIQGVRSPGRPHVAPSGDLWVSKFGPVFVKLAPDGEQLASVPIGWADALAVDGRGHVWRGTAETLFHYDENGILVNSQSWPATAVAVGPGGEVWIAGGHEVRRLDESGQLLGAFTLPLEDAAHITDIALDEGSGAAWLVVVGQEGWSRTLVKVTASGQVQTEALIPHSSGRPVVDTTGQVWLTNRDEGQVLRLAPDGSVAGRHAMPNWVNAVAADPGGYVWVAAHRTVFKLALDGAILAEYRPGELTTAVAPAPDGSLWIIHGHIDHTLTRIAP